MGNYRTGYIPLDFLRGTIVGTDKSYLLNKLNWSQYINTKTKQPTKHRTKKPYTKANYKNFNFYHYPHSSRIVFEGSIHKLHNYPNSNDDLFTESNFNKVLEELYQELRLEPRNLRLSQFEPGLNCITKENPMDILDSCICHKGKKFHNMEDISGLTVKHSAYLLKIYLKKEDTLRIELKITEFSTLKNSLGFSGQTLQDIIDADFGKLRDKLVNEFDSVILVDPSIPICDQKLWFETPSNWLDGNLDKDRKYRAKKQLREMNKKKGVDIQETIKSEMKRQFALLDSLKLKSAKL